MTIDLESIHCPANTPMHRMRTNISPYIDHMVEMVKQKIGSCISYAKVGEIVSRDVQYHLRSNSSLRFNEWYHRTLANKENQISTDGFFREFKQMYALQGIDNSYLDRIEREKRTLLELIEQRRLHDLYFEYFATAKIKQKSKFVQKDRLFLYEIRPHSPAR